MPVVDELAVTATLGAPRDDVYDLLRDVEGYGRYCRSVEGVAREGDGSVGTAYTRTLSWWRVGDAARVGLTELDPPRRIGWRVVEGPTARGAWVLEPADPDGPGTDVTLTVRYDPDSAAAGPSLPAFVPLSTVVERGGSAVEREGERIAERVAAELEGESRDVGLSVEHRHDVGCASEAR